MCETISIRLSNAGVVQIMAARLGIEDLIELSHGLGMSRDLAGFHGLQASENILQQF